MRRRDLLKKAAASGVALGGFPAVLSGRKAGKVRFLGFSAHSVEAALALMDGFAFDTILFPVNYATWHAGGFGPQVLAKAQEKKMGILALKALAKGPWPEGAQKRYPKCWYEPFDQPADAEPALRFTLSPPGDGRDPARRRGDLPHGPRPGGAVPSHVGGGSGSHQAPRPHRRAAVPLPSGWVSRQSNGRRTERDPLARSERGVWGVRRSTPQLNHVSRVSSR